MKKIRRWFNQMFAPEDMNGLDIAQIVEAFNENDVRRAWFVWLFDELKQINLEVDKRLLTGADYGFTDLCARRQALQDVLEAVLSAKRGVLRSQRPNPRPMVGGIDLDRVTA